jgi:hypothetical protein
MADDTDPIISPDGDVVRILQRLIDTQLRPLQQLNFEQGAATGRWLLASLLVLNAGAAAAVLGADSLSPRLYIPSLSLWLLGTVCALGTGFSNLWVAAKASQEVTKAIGSAEKSIALGQLDPFDWQAMGRRIAKSVWPIYLFGGLATVAFAAGAVLATMQAAAS